MKICLAFSAGGHHTEMKRLMDAFNGHDVFFVTIRKASTENLTNVHYVKDTMGPTRLHMLINLIFITLQSLKILSLERPDAILSTGADVTIPMCYLGKLIGARIIFIESICRVTELSFAGRIVYPIADLFLVQWIGLLGKYTKAKYWGQVI